MDIRKKLNNARNNIINNMSKVSSEHIEPEENHIRDKVNAELNYEQIHLTGYKCKQTGQVDDIKVREIKNGKDRYSVQDLSYSYHYNGVTSSWQYGSCVEDKDVQAREISVKDGNKTHTLTLKKQQGTYQEYGDSRDSGNVSDNKAESSYFKSSVAIPQNLDINDINAIRYHFRQNESISNFLDKFVIVTSDEKKAYKEYAQRQDQVSMLQKSRQDKLMGLHR